MLLVFDEARRCASSFRDRDDELGELAEDLEDRVRTTRKYGLGRMFVAQDLAPLRPAVLGQMPAHAHGLRPGGEEHPGAGSSRRSATRGHADPRQLRGPRGCAGGRVPFRADGAGLAALVHGGRRSSWASMRIERSSVSATGRSSDEAGEAVREAEAAEHGQVFTRRWLVEGMLDLAGLRPERDLSAERIVEPACGNGAFLGAIVERLADSASRHGWTLEDDQILAVDLDPACVARASDLAESVLVARGISRHRAARLAHRWVRSADFLLDVPDDELAATLVVGNPPYVRLEHLDPALVARYRARWSTMRGRADLYVGFLERGLRALVPGGRLCVICADLWMHNAYGRRLRAMVAAEFRLDAVVELRDAAAFESEVQAYPAVVLVSRPKDRGIGPTVFATASSRFERPGMQSLLRWIASGRDRRWSDDGGSRTSSAPPVRLLGAPDSGTPRRARAWGSASRPGPTRSTSPRTRRPASPSGCSRS